jgi:hypothetical protein
LLIIFFQYFKIHWPKAEGTEKMGAVNKNTVNMEEYLAIAGLSLDDFHNIVWGVGNGTAVSAPKNESRKATISGPYNAAIKSKRDLTKFL